jgi:uncharacterized protein (TIGR02679 family)
VAALEVDYERLHNVLGGDNLQPLRARLRRWLEGASRDQRVLAVEPHERRALEGLLGQRPGTGRSMRLELAALDASLARAGLAPDLWRALAALDGPLTDRVAERERERRNWQAVFERARIAGLDGWLDHPRNRGLVKRLAQRLPGRAARLLDQAAAVLRALPADGVPASRLAAETLGDAHALDAGRPVATLVLSVLQADAATDFERAREAWAASGVLVNELSKPALVLNLPSDSATPAGALAIAAARAGEPLHLSLRLLVAHRPRWPVRGATVHVCENPAVVAAAAARLGQCARPLVCTDGMPSASQRQLLSQLREDGADIRYHGDFDWPGIGIGNLVMERFNARPWRFSRTDFDVAPASELSLTGLAVVPRWDAALGEAMRHRGTAVHEEAVLDSLLDDLQTNGNYQAERW